MVIAEISANHHQDFETAVELVKQADAVSDAVKIQMFTPDQMASPGGMPLDEWGGLTLYELYEKAYMPIEWVPELKKHCKHLIASVYHPDMVDIAEEMGIETYKISSFEITYLPLIEKVAKTLKPVIISTGMADLEEIATAYKIVTHDDITLLKCTSKYPAEIDDLNLATINDMKNRFRCKVGFSDHTIGYMASVVAASLGADVIEKHITLDKKGLDGEFSIYPEEFQVMYDLIQEARKALGEVKYGGEKRFRRVNENGKWLRKESHDRKNNIDNRRDRLAG